MSARALEFVEMWVSEKIEEGGYPEAEEQESTAKQWAAECRQAAMQQGVSGDEIDEAFDDLAEFIEGEIEEAREREKDEDDEDDEDDEEDDDEDEVDQQGDGEDK